MAYRQPSQKLTQTRYPELAVGRIAPGCWRFHDMTDPDRGFASAVGPYYKTKGEALADLENYIYAGGWRIA